MSWISASVAASGQLFQSVNCSDAAISRSILVFCCGHKRGVTYAGIAAAEYLSLRVDLVDMARGI